MATTLTPEQIAVILAPPPVAMSPSHQLEITETVVYKFFEKYPKAQEKFAPFKGVPLGSLRVKEKK